MILIISGEAGVGKTFQSLQFEEPITFLDLEKRGGLTLQQFPERMVDLIDVKQLTEDYHDDYYTSYRELGRQITQFIRIADHPLTLVVDGISDVRGKYARAKWLHDHPGKKNPGMYAYTEINTTVRDLLFPLINMARAKDFNLVFTAQFHDTYCIVVDVENGKPVKKSARDTRVPNTQDWEDYSVDTLVVLSTRRKRYYAEITKSPVGCDEFEITGRSLFEELLERGL